MIWLPPSSDEYEYRCIEWRDFERENVQEKIDALKVNGWEVDGNEMVKSGFSTDLIYLQFRRPKQALHSTSKPTITS